MRCRLRAVRWRLDPPLRGRAPRRGPGGRTGAGVATHRPGGPGPGRRDRGGLQHQLRPLVEAAARAQAANALTAVIDRAIAADLAERDVDYGDFVTIQRDASGAITAMTTDMAALNQLRAQLVAQILSRTGGVDASEIRIPLGSLVDSELVWARGPELRVRALRVGTVSAEFRSDFSQAGVNQTLHRIELEVAVPVTLILPGGQTELTIETGLRVAGDRHCWGGARHISDPERGRVIQRRDAFHG